MIQRTGTRSGSRAFWLSVVVIFSQASQADVFLPPPPSPYQAGTFWLLSQTNWPPIPYNPFPDLPLYELKDGSFAVDDRQVDYEAYRVQYELDRSLRQMEWRMGVSYGTEGAEGGGPPPPGEGGSGGSYEPPDIPPPAFLTSTQLCLLPPVFTNLSSTSLTATNTVPGAMYDLFTVTNLQLTNWTWLERGMPGQTNWYRSSIPEFESYYQLGTMLDTDGDGLTDAYEGLTSKTNPLLADTDGDGWSDWYELAVSLTDPLTPEPVPSLTGRPISTCSVP